MKHIEIDVHFIREQVVVRILEVQYVPTEFQVANILTKPLSAARFTMLKAKLNIGLIYKIETDICQQKA